MNYLVPKLKTLTRTFTSAKSVKGAVVANGPQCAHTGAKILNMGGSAVDAAIATMLSEGVILPPCLGLGGGFIMTVYSKEKGTVETLDAREVAPKNSTLDMFSGDSSLLTRGGKAVAVPGALRGYWEAYKKYGGKVPWTDLIQPSMDFCKTGVPMNAFLERVTQADLDVLKNDEILSQTFIDPQTHKSYPLLYRIQRPRLAKTLEQVANDGADVLYDGKLTENFIRDIQGRGGIITVEDMNTYKPQWRTPIKFTLPSKQILYTSPLPGSGIIVVLILNILNGILDHSQPHSISNWHKIIESFKFGFGRRTELGDPGFSDFSTLIDRLASPSYAEDIRKLIHGDKTNQDPNYYGASIIQTGHGTSNICVLAPNGDAVAASSSINLNWGAGFVSKSTGIILNDTMDDFSSPNIISSYHLPPSEANLIKPGKRPLSSMSPSIILDENGDVAMVVGAAGGPKIITSIALTIIRHLWFKMDIQEAVSEKRLHHQLFPMLIELEESYKDDKEVLEALDKIGHKYKIVSGFGFNAVTAIARKDGIINGAIDPRRGGEKTLVF